MNKFKGAKKFFLVPLNFKIADDLFFYNLNLFNGLEQTQAARKWSQVYPDIRHCFRN